MDTIRGEPNPILVLAHLLSEKFRPGVLTGPSIRFSLLASADQRTKISTASTQVRSDSCAGRFIPSGCSSCVGTYAFASSTYVQAYFTYATT